MSVLETQKGSYQEINCVSTSTKKQWLRGPGIPKTKKNHLFVNGMIQNAGDMYLGGQEKPWNTGWCHINCKQIQK
jgi:hypothetical protein